MRLLCVSFGFLGQRAYQWKAVELAQRTEAFLAVVPALWRPNWSSVPVPPEPGPLDRVPNVRVPLRLNHNKHVALLPPLLLDRILREFRPSVVDFDNEPFNLSSAQVVRAVDRRAPGARVFLHASQNLMKSYPPPFSQLERYVFNRCSGVFARSPAAASVLRRRGLPEHRIHLLGHGVSLEEFTGCRTRQQEDRVDEGSVLFAGFLSHQKAVDTLLRACADTPRFERLTIAGDGPEREALESLARQLGLAARVAFLGRIDQEALKVELGRHACLALPSRTTPRLVEQFGRVLVEAMAAGCPIVASDSGSIPEVVGEAGLIFREDDVAALAKALDAVLASATVRATLREAGLRRVHDVYEWSVRAEHMLQVFRSASVGPAVS